MTAEFVRLQQQPVHHVLHHFWSQLSGRKASPIVTFICTAFAALLTLVALVIAVLNGAPSIRLHATGGRSAVIPSPASGSMQPAADELPVGDLNVNITRFKPAKHPPCPAWLDEYAAWHRAHRNAPNAKYLVQDCGIARNRTCFGLGEACRWFAAQLQ
jgi:hypothetical protein